MYLAAVLGSTRTLPNFGVEFDVTADAEVSGMQRA